MSSPNSDSRVHAVEARRRDRFRDWLAALPPIGWAGTAGDLAAELAAFLAAHPLRFGTSFPVGRGVSSWLQEVEDEIHAARRRLVFSRSKSERTITITAVEPAA